MNVFGQFLDEREDGERGKTEAPESAVARLLGRINTEFYAAADAKEWLRDEPAVRLALLWPATWLNRRAVSLPVSRYASILGAILDGIRRHGKLAGIKHFPSYLFHAIEQWFVHHGDELYQERKHIRNAIDLTALRAGPTHQNAPDPIEAMAAAHRLLSSRRKTAKTAAHDPKQVSFLDL